MRRCPVPARASYRDLLRDLLGRPVSVRPGPDQQLTDATPSYLAVYRFDDGGVAAVVVADLALSTATGGAIGMVPPAQVQAEVAVAGRLEGDLLEFFHEVVNVGAKLLNSPSTPHVVLHEVLAVPGEVPEDLAEVLLQPRVREDWRVEVDGYGEGAVTLLHP